MTLILSDYRYVGVPGLLAAARTGGTVSLYGANRYRLASLFCSTARLRGLRPVVLVLPCLRLDCTAL